ncbi:hypothetical protein BOTBODRAFT_172717 [Botryobasidium botryosum FD-172 SS1]|uniref:Uncharacterized protein n=1 Tax=Botryobasidium botryosum (strain FD-172 SS1) TaxID=930990 RepID=A0A067MYZ9_BOTB1|nr:hypothetical protein BOTBODRAFT_172717 [Botryobasidium botryosum FD-172 SS1]
MSDSNNTSTARDEPLLLPPPTSSDGTTPTLDLNSEQSLKLDALGPMVVNSDGTLSRIANWVELTEAERANTLRVLGARNRLRIAKEKAKLEAESKSSDVEEAK